MELKTKRCRCCAKDTFERLDVKAEVDPFFARYGLQIEVSQSIDIPLFDWGLRRKVDRLPSGLATKIHPFLDRLRRGHVLTGLSIKIPYGFCTSCSFLAPWYEVGDDQLRDYYAFYLEKEYKQARTAFQPGFAQLGQVMGSKEEGESRRSQHEAFINPYLTKLRQELHKAELALLDYGGGSGMLLPKLDWVKGTVLDVDSSSDPRNASQSNYEVVQCLHVLEHVGHPLETVQQLRALCAPGGLIYIEVPLEFPGERAVRAGQLPPCHEHLNKLSLKAVEALLAAADLEPEVVQTAEVDFLHLDGLTPVVRGLARRPFRN
jgi:hypothetical protein